MTQELRERVAKALCQEKCAFYGEPPCWGLDPAEYVIEPWNPDKCDEPGCGALADAAIALVLEEAEAAAVHALMPNKAASLAASKAIRALKEGK